MADKVHDLEFYMDERFQFPMEFINQGLLKEIVSVLQRQAIQCVNVEHHLVWQLSIRKLDKIA